MLSEPVPTRRRFTAEEVLRMVEAGILREDEPCELIDGELFTMSPQGPVHRSRAVKLHIALERAFGAGYHVQDHSPIAAGPDSLPEPDVAVVRGEVDDFLDRHPSGPDVVLVVEVSVTSHAIDRAKAGVYARAGVREFWHLDVPGRRLTVRTEPRPALGEYAAERHLHDGDAAVANGARIEVSAMLPPPPTRAGGS